MSTTTHRDLQAVKFLARITGEDPDRLGSCLIEQGMDLSGVSLDTLLARDLKEFVLSHKKVLISQVMVPSFAWNRERDDAIQAELGRMKTRYGADIVLVLFTSVVEKSSELYGAADPGLLSAVFAEGLPVRLEGVMSRKLDFLPWFGARLQSQTRH